MNTLNIFAAVISILVAMGISSVAGQNTKENTKMINRSTPILHVRSVEPAIKFWTEKFGFKVTIEVPEGDHIGFAALENGNVELMYQTYSGMKADPTNPLADSVEKGPSYIFMEVSDISKVIDSLKGGEIVQGLHETFYGSKEIIAKEPGGHYVIFSQMPVR
jgi:uncharacterized glyoxalase superfamily protein PhnB